MDMGDCAICCETCEDDHTTTLSCNHSYHTSCILEWYRIGNSNCPLCRDDPEYSYERSWRERFAMISRKKRTSLPKEVQREFAKLDKARQNEREAKREATEYYNTHKEIIKKNRRLAKRPFTFKLTQRRLMKRIGRTTVHGVSRMAPPVVYTEEE